MKLGFLTPTAADIEKASRLGFDGASLMPAQPPRYA